MKLNNVIDIINKKYPEKLQYSWDNSGLNIGDENMDVKKILLTLEVSSDVVDEAIKNNVDLILSHHPFLFGKINRINSSTPKGNLIYKLIKNNISVYCMHTNYDVSEDGLNNYFIGFIDLDNIQNIEILDKIGSYDDYISGQTFGLGRVVTLKSEIDTKVFIENIKTKLGLDSVKFVGDINRKINRFAVVTGSGAEYFEYANSNKFDLLITGDVKYHQAMDAIEMKSNILDCGHYGTEYIFTSAMKEFIEKAIPELEIVDKCGSSDPFINL